MCVIMGVSQSTVRHVVKKYDNLSEGQELSEQVMFNSSITVKSITDAPSVTLEVFSGKRVTKFTLDNENPTFQFDGEFFIFVDNSIIVVSESSP